MACAPASSKQTSVMRRHRQHLKKVTRRANDIIHVDLVAEFRLLTPARDPNFVMIRVVTQEGKVHNFGLDRASLSHIVRVWAFDLAALKATAETGAPHHGKPFGSPDKKAS